MSSNMMYVYFLLKVKISYQVFLKSYVGISSSVLKKTFHYSVLLVHGIYKNNYIINKK